MSKLIINGIRKLIHLGLRDCRNVTALASRALENDLSWREKIAFKAHLLICEACRSYLEQLEFMHELFEKQEAGRETAEPAPRLGEEAAERLKKALRSSNFMLLFVVVYCC
ncbi:MAG: zf-HC2 domain-containing protein [Acidobacteria bacterium]|nr:zf-HC2 domain-containing protein [Acidobacteriota bacterium]